MRKARESFPYTKSSSISLGEVALNLLAQVRAPGETWSKVVERLVRYWAVSHGLTVYEQPTLEQGLQARQDAGTLPLFTDKENGNGKHKPK